MPDLREDEFDEDFGPDDPALEPAPPYWVPGNGMPADAQRMGLTHHVPDGALLDFAGKLDSRRLKHRIVASAIALVIYANWPLAPPRLMPELGTIDVMQHFAAAGWWGDAASAPRGLGDATNQFAAMPSLHFGWSLWCGIQMWGFGKRWWRVAAVTYPTLQVIVVLATANHFFLDVLGGATCIVAGYAIVTVIGRALGKTGSKTGSTEVGEVTGTVVALQPGAPTRAAMVVAPAARESV